LRKGIAVELKQGSFRPEYKGRWKFYLCWLANYEGEDAEANHLESSIAVPDRSNFWSLTLPASVLLAFDSSPNL
jgi:hypothetical protein